MRRRIIFATGNEGKMREIREILKDMDADVLSMKEAKIEAEIAESVPDNKRTARFVCAIAAVLPGGEVITTRGVIEGRIDYVEKGKNGFGYDPIFYVPEFGCTTAQLSAEEKNRVSHRGRALEAMKTELMKRVF